ncbi:ATP-binding protein [Streptomyces sp. 058-1L]|uniref:ATP-binding protein n=1 Tax=Streptomyces sp. 058-1L TaxID=2789266 RepID=UPI0039802540
MEQLLTTYGETEQDGQESGTPAVKGSAAYDMGSGGIARARAFARDFLVDAQSTHGLVMTSRAMDDAQLVVSELATNVCKYAPGPCLLDLEAGDGTLTITMWDSGSVLPSAAQADPTRAGQHGLEIVLMVCQSFEVRREPVGKRVRVEISLLDDAQGAPADPTSW